MKILYHHRTLSKDGQNVHIAEMIAAFRRAGHEVEVVGPGGYQQASFGSDGGFLSRVRASLPRTIGELLELGYSAVALVRLWRAYRRFRPDFLYERYNLFLLAGTWLKKLCGVPFALEVNAPLSLERARDPGLSLLALARWSEAAAWRAADVVLPVTYVLAEHVAETGVPRERILVVPNGIVPEEFAASLDGATVRAQYGLNGKIVIGFTGFLRPWHGLPAVIDVLADMQSRYDLHFLVVGDGEVRAELEEAARRKKVQHRLTITGIVKRESIPSHIAAFDIALQPMATAYASPLKLFEYLALARAVIAPDQPNVREVLKHEHNALLFTPSDSADFKAAIERLVADIALRKRLGAAGAATIEQRGLTWDDNVGRVLNAMTPMITRASR